MSEPVGHILQRALQRQGLGKRIDRRLPAHVWREAVGHELAGRVQPTWLAGGTLHLLVEDHRWRDQLDAARGLLIERVNARLGRRLVKQLQFGLAHAGLLEAARAARRPVLEETPAAAPARLPAADHLPPDLREALLGAAAASARRAGARA